jgi:hypothetical protein
MPLNEAQGFHSSNLTEKEQREALKAVYGLEERGNHMSPNLSSEELEQMRRILAQHDANTAQKAMQEFDLNKPPAPPYVFREYPFLLYNHPTTNGERQVRGERAAKPAHNHEERQRMLAEGWSEDPFPSPEPVEVPLTAEEHAEAAEIDQRLNKKRRS